jgi:hypothetical protein
MNKLVGAIVTAAAIAFVTAPVTATLAQAKSHKVECFGVKGKKEGYKTTAKHCTKLGGSTTKPADAAAPAAEAEVKAKA